jgi:diguanylate cyclase (GGDEF)-like protein
MASADERRVLEQLIEQHFRDSGMVLLSGMALAATLAWTLLQRSPGDHVEAVWLWLGLTETAMAIRLALTQYYLHSRVRHEAGQWRRLALMGTVLTGCGWGAVALVYAQLTDPLAQLVVAFTLLGVCAGSAVLVGSVAGTVQVFGVLALTPTVTLIILQSVTQGGVLYTYLAAATSYFLYVVMFRGPRRIHRMLHDVIGSGLMRESLLTRLEDAEAMAGVGHFIWDHGQRRASLSAEGRQLLGLEAEAEIGEHTLSERLAEHDRERIEQISAEAVRLGQPQVHFEMMVLNPKGNLEIRAIRRFDYDESGGVARTMTTLLDITDLKKTQRELQSLAYRDQLTGLVNRTLFLERIRRYAAMASRQPGRMALLMMDLDHFKAVNDTLGHEAGDRLLIEAGRRILDSVGTVDTVARLGGDEFAVILTDLSDEQAREQAGQTAGRIISALSRPFAIGRREVFVSASVGITLCPTDSSDPETLMRYADVALYDAKARGRSRHQFYSTNLTLEAHERLSLEGDLRHALDRQELELFYQPKVALRGRHLVGAEALLRWRHPRRGLVMPTRFIGLAEDTGLIVPIGEWVLRTAMAAAAEWNAHRPAGQPPFRVAINLSSRQFMEAGLVGRIEALLHQTGCRAAWIELELTESLLLDERSRVRDMLEDLRQLGFSLAIDDFGTGYSALSYLTRFPISTLKIDRIFLRQADRHPERSGVLGAIVAMGASLRLEVVAEGVETEAQVAMLDQLGCQLGQGWLFGKPIPQAEFGYRHQLIPIEPTQAMPFG